ncbi:acylneuraminate cytidylyltransferase family protein [bacterium]|nr:acylneuraminate cytidylyltransferase family protein [bacterium]MBU1752448.1 acylneuraminate cytidylyltransferase family protein [bacterium]
MQHLKFLGLIPARGGSKGIIKKCITPLLDKPLIAYTIEEAKKSIHLHRIIVSTDDKNIASVSKEYGAEIPFMRPKELAQDDTPTLPVIQHALNTLRSQGYVPDYIVLLQPTSPLRDVSHIDAAIEKIIQTQSDMVVSLCKVTQHPFWMRRIDREDKVYPFIETKNTYHRRQDLPELYRLNGAITVTRREVIEAAALAIDEKKKLDIRGYVMEEAVSVDVDTPIDLFIAQKLLEERA